LEGVGLEDGFDGVAHGAVNEPVDHWWHKGRHPLARVGHDLDLTQQAGLPSGVGKLLRELREQSACLVAQTRPGHTVLART
jgi:hypothetical protein